MENKMNYAVIDIEYLDCYIRDLEKANNEINYLKNKLREVDRDKLIYRNIVDDIKKHFEDHYTLDSKELDNIIITYI